MLDGLHARKVAQVAINRNRDRRIVSCAVSMFEHLPPSVIRDGRARISEVAQAGERSTRDAVTLRRARLDGLSEASNQLLTELRSVKDRVGIAERLTFKRFASIVRVMSICCGWIDRSMCD